MSPIYIYKDVQEYVPNENTIAYYKFDWNLNDSSENSHDMTLSTWTVTYWETEQWWKYGYFNRNTWTNYRNYSWFNFDWKNTLSIRLNLQQSITSWPATIIEIWENSSNSFYRLCDNLNYAYALSSSSDVSALTTWTRHNAIFARDWNSASIYLDWALVRSWTPSVTWRTNQTVRFRVNQVADTSTSTYANNAYLSDLIWESKAWSAQEVSDYYNMTKWNYWL